MDAAAEGAEEVLTNYAQIVEYLSNLPPEVSPVEDDRMDCIVSRIISLLPTPFVPAPDSDDDHFSLTSSDSEDAAAAADRHAMQDGDGQDHISHLPDDLLSNIVSRLPTKEAARTMVLSTRWRCVWAATPLLLDDAHLRAVDGLRNFNAVRAVSRCVAAHPGPVRAVRITHTSFHRQEYALERLVTSLADKNIQDLILFNRPWPLDMPLPDNILRCASLSRLYIGVWRWRFPDTTPHRPAFPNLHELGLFHSIIEDREVDALLAHCPKLKILSFAMAYGPPPPIRISSGSLYVIFGRADGSPSRFRVRSRSLCIVVEWICSFDEIIVEDVPCLERLLFECSYDRRPIKIVHAPRLEVLGFLDLSLHALEIGGIVIRAGMNVRASAMLPSFKILAVKVRFSHDMEVKMLHTLLRCFPRLQTFHVMSIRSSSLDSVDCAEFWESLGSCDCLESYLKTFVLHRFQGLDCEYMLLDYILKNGKVLKTLGIVCSDSDDVLEEVLMSGSVGVGNAPSGGSSGSNDVIVERGPIPGSIGEGSVSSGGSSGSHDVVMEGGPMSGSCGEGDAPGGSSSNIIYICPASPCWSFQNAIDLSVEDPFCVLKHDKARMASRVEA